MQEHTIDLEQKVKRAFMTVKLKRVFIFIDCILIIASFSFCVIKFYGYYSDRISYGKIQEQYQKKTVKTDNNTAPIPADRKKDSGPGTFIQASIPSTLESESADPFQGLLAINPETVGWISIENTHINYPVVRHDDNVFYLTNNFERKRSGAGCIFMDYRNEAPEKDMYAILYGHHMKDMSMFRDLVMFKNKDFFNNNGRIVFSSEIAVNTDDRILTLSTCSYESADARTVVHAKMISEK